jgi:ABC-2 type transport system ATP-binding protein
MIETHQLSKSFGEFLAVEEVTITVNPGEVLALLGPNGAGKTTTVRMLTSILSPSSGWAKIAGFDVQHQPEQVRAHVGVLTEMHGLYGRMAAEEYLDFFGQLYQVEPNQRKNRIAKLLTEFGLYDDRSRKTGEYSKGMRQKLALARALMHEPPVLLMDEPTSAMDPESARLVRDSIHQLRSNKRAILICTHNLPEAEELADQIAIIKNGSIVAQGTPDQLKQTLLGSIEYEVKLSRPLSGEKPDLPDQTILTQKGSDWFRYTSPDPKQDNPELLAALLGQGLRVTSLSEVNRSLETVYLQAISSGREEYVG